MHQYRQSCWACEPDQRRRRVSETESLGGLSRETMHDSEREESFFYSLFIFNAQNSLDYPHGRANALAASHTANKISLVPNGQIDSPCSVAFNFLDNEF